MIIRIGTLTANGGFDVLGLMWCPALSALITTIILRRKFSAFGWRPGKVKYLLLSFAVRIVYSFISYIIIWSAGWGTFYNGEFVHNVAATYGWKNYSDSSVMLLYLLRTVVFGMIINSVAALGEETGWRGFLVPELFKDVGYTKSSFIVGIVWAVWHFPLILFADYNTGTPVWYGLTCFTVMVISLSFIYTWFRLRSKSLWAPVILHATHNLFIQALFTPLTKTTADTKYFIDEFGVVIPFVCMCFAFFYWSKRSLLTPVS